MSRPARVAFICTLALIAVVLLAAGTFLAVIQTDWFKSKVRERIVATAELASGGRVEIGRFDYNWRSLTAEVSPFVLHGTEPASAPPLFRADKIQVGMKIISALKKQVDIASLDVERPHVYVTVAADGSTNIPSPKVKRSEKNSVEELLDLKVGRLALRDGMAEYNSQQTPLDVQADQLQVALGYDPSRPCYLGSASSGAMRVSSSRIHAPLAFGFNTKLALERNAIQLRDFSASSAGWKVQGKGSIENLASPRTKLDLRASASVKELRNAFGLKLEPSGEVSFEGQASIDSAPFQYKVDGKLAGRGLGYAYNEMAVRNVAVESRVEATPAHVSLAGLKVAALHGDFRGSLTIQDWKRLALTGEAHGFALQELARTSGRNIGELDGVLSGPLQVTAVLTPSGLADVTGDAQLDLAPVSGKAPLAGALVVSYDQRAGQVRLGESRLTIGESHIAGSGTLGRQLSFHLDSQDLTNFFPLLPLIGESPPQHLPLTLRGGTLTVDAAVTGPLDNPRVSGRADVGKLAWDQHEIDHASATFDLTRASVDLHSLAADQGKMHVEGQGHAGLENWKLKDSSAISAALTVSHGDIQALATQAGVGTPMQGSVSGTLRVSGSLESPLVSATLEAQNVAAYGEQLDQARGSLTLTGTTVEVSNAELRAGPARITLSGAYNHTEHTWNDGSLRFQISSSGLDLAQIQHVKEFRPDVGGEVQINASGTAKVVKGMFDLTAFNGSVIWRDAMVSGRSYGSVELMASTQLPVLAVGMTANVGGIQIHGNGQWRLEGDYPGEAHITIPRVPFELLHQLAPEPHLRKELPFDGFLEGEAVITGALNRPSAGKAEITLSNVQVNARPTAQPAAGAQVQDLVLRNAQPVRFEATAQGIEIQSASFTAKDTTLTATGRLSFDAKSAWDLSAQGRANLTILQIFNPDLLASGASTMNLRVRGSLTDPQVEGRLELQNASLFLRDVPNGVSEANGLILFDRNRATVQNLTATTGGGKVTFEPGGFIGFRGMALVYRLQATADNVRYRSQDGVSVSVNAALSLVGTSDNSVLSGSVTVVRAVFNPRTDVGALLAATARPVSVPLTPNEYLRGMQFDVRVVSAPSLQVETTLTHNIQADASLRIRGSLDRPAILGDISVNSGQIEFFGNKYTINRGEVNFYNPARIEPVLDMDLETKVRGITVDISFSGPLNKLNFSYRSDPPLEANEIIALLAVGRAPSAAGPLASSQNTSNTAFVATGSNALLGQAIAPATGRLEKLFGVSHIKIDPQLTDITTIPQARLTFEQQVSPAITLTYITNLAVTNQQIVRIQWDFSKRWSAVALRDENGAFSIDFQFKKTFR